MRITQWGEYGVHCCVYLALREKTGLELANAGEIAESQKIDILYAQQILQRLRKANLVESIRGPQGGYRLSRPASDISLKDILRAAEGDTFEVLCETKPVSEERCCASSACNLRTVWYDLKVHVDSFLESRTLAALAENTALPFLDQPVQIARTR